MTYKCIPIIGNVNGMMKPFCFTYLIDKNQNKETLYREPGLKK